MKTCHAQPVWPSPSSCEFLRLGLSSHFTGGHTGQYGARSCCLRPRAPDTAPVGRVLGREAWLWAGATGSGSAATVSF